MTHLTTSETDGTVPTSFTSLKELFDSIGFTTGDCIRVNNVSLDDFRSIEEIRDSECRKLRFFYESQSETLIITVPTLPHEMLHKWLDRSIITKLDAMGMGNQVDSIGSATYTSTSGGNLETSLEGDSSLTLVSRTGRDVWPVLVIEAGYSQTMQELRTKARAWFLASNFEVKIVILAKMSISEGRIVLEKWKGVQAGSRTGTVRTRAESRRVPECVHTIQISRPDITDENHLVSPESYRVSRGALRLEFEDLFLRSANGEEADIVITEEELQRFAAKVWARVS
jgi:hypothetical protein